MTATPATPAWYASVATFLGGWPDDYMVIDCETNGTGPECLPLQIAWLAVRDRKPAPEISGSILLDWSRPEYGYGDGYLASRIEATRNAMSARGKPYRFDATVLKETGLDPKKGLAELGKALWRYFDAQWTAEAGANEFRHEPIVGFNHIAFDLPIIQRCFDRCFPGFGRANIRDREALDLGLVEKARVGGIIVPSPQIHPEQQGGIEARRAWYQRVDRVYGVKGWSLDAARSTYSLACDPSLAHDAGADCNDTHLLLEAMRGSSGEWGCS